MRVKIFNNENGLEQADFIVPVTDRQNFNVSAHNTDNTTAVESSEDAIEVLVNGSTYVLDLSNKPTVSDGQYAQLNGYEAKSGGGYQGVWEIGTIPVVESPTE